MDELTKRGVKVIGVSMDKVEDQKSFRDKNKFPFPLLADPEGKVVEAFGVVKIADGKLCGRQSFLIKDGKVIWVDAKAKTAEHAKDVLAAIDAIPKAE
jgi:peroxiredoxin Q/BCP